MGRLFSPKIPKPPPIPEEDRIDEDEANLGAGNIDPDRSAQYAAAAKARRDALAKRGRSRLFTSKIYQGNTRSGISGGYTDG